MFGLEFVRESIPGQPPGESELAGVAYIQCGQNPTVENGEIGDLIIMGIYFVGLRGLNGECY